MKPSRSNITRRLFSAATVCTWAPAAWPQDAPVRLLIGFPTGVVDQVARWLADALAAPLHQPVVVDARPGAAGRLALEAARSARPDGDTLVIAPHGAMTLFPHVFRQLRYDPVADFAPISQVATFDFALAAAPGVPVQHLKDLPAWVRNRPDVTGYCSPGVGTVPHFLGERYAASARLALTHIPFKSPSEILPAVLGNQVPLVFLPLGDLLPSAVAGKLRLLATTGKTRAVQAPEVPTFLESGVNLEQTGWIGTYAPVGVPAMRLAQLETAVVQALQSPRLRGLMHAANLRATGSTSAELARLQASESRSWADVVRQSGFKPES